jgi:prefoldin subunit 5
MKLFTNHLDHPFLELIKKADHVVVEKANKEEYISPFTMSFNGFLTINEFIKEISFELDNYHYYVVESEINTIQFKAERIKFLNKIIKDLENINESSFKIKNDKIIQHLQYNFIDDFSQNLINKNKPLYYYDYLETQIEYLNKCIDRIKQEKQDLESLTQEDIDRTYGTSSSDLSKCIGINKIKTSLSKNNSNNHTVNS